MDFEEMVWHDGILSEIALRSDGELRIDCELYASTDSRVRRNFVVVCMGVSDISCSMDMAAMLDNGRAGNITDAKVVVKSAQDARIKVSFADGYLDVQASSLTIAQGAKGST